jgi:hypothetical protein
MYVACHEAQWGDGQGTIFVEDGKPELKTRRDLILFMLANGK